MVETVLRALDNDAKMHKRIKYVRHNCWPYAFPESMVEKINAH